jgi:hypothetical protein
MQLVKISAMASINWSQSYSRLVSRKGPPSCTISSIIWNQSLSRLSSWKENPRFHRSGTYLSTSIRKLTYPHRVRPLLNMPARLWAPLANRETGATERVQPAEEPPSTAGSAPLANDSSPLFGLFGWGNPVAQHLTQLGASENLNN